MTPFGTPNYFLSAIHHMHDTRMAVLILAAGNKAPIRKSHHTKKAAFPKDAYYCPHALHTMSPLLFFLHTGVLVASQFEQHRTI